MSLICSRNRTRPTLVTKQRGTKIGQRINLSKLDCLKLNALYGCLDESNPFVKRKYETICDFLGLESTYPKKKYAKPTREKEKTKNTTEKSKTTSPKTKVTPSSSKVKPAPPTTKKPSAGNVSKMTTPAVIKNKPVTQKSEGWGLNKLHATTRKPMIANQTRTSMRPTVTTIKTTQQSAVKVVAILPRRIQMETRNNLYG